MIVDFLPANFNLKDDWLPLGFGHWTFRVASAIIIPVVAAAPLAAEAINRVAVQLLRYHPPGFILADAGIQFFVGGSATPVSFRTDRLCHNTIQNS